MSIQAGKGPGLTIGPESGFGLNADQIKALFEAVTDEVLNKLNTVPLFLQGSEVLKKREGELVYAMGSPAWAPTVKKGLHYFDGSIWRGLVDRNTAETITADWNFLGHITYGGDSLYNELRLKSDTRTYQLAVGGSSTGPLNEELYFYDETGGTLLLSRVRPENYFKFYEPINVGNAASKAFNVMGSRNADSPYGVPSIGVMTEGGTRWFYLHGNNANSPALIYGPSSLYTLGLRVGVDDSLGGTFNHIATFLNAGEFHLFPTAFAAINQGSVLKLSSSAFAYSYSFNTYTGGVGDHYLEIKGSASDQIRMLFSNIDNLYVDFYKSGQNISYRNFASGSGKTIRHLFLNNSVIWRGFGIDVNGLGVNDFWWYNYVTGESLWWASNDNFRIGGTLFTIAPNARLLVNGNVNDIANISSNINRTATFSLNGMVRNLGIVLNTLPSPTGDGLIPIIYGQYNSYTCGFGYLNNNNALGTFVPTLFSAVVHSTGVFNESYQPFAIRSNFGAVLPPPVGSMVFTWNRDGGSGRGDFICNKGGGSGGFEFWLGDHTSQGTLVRFTNTYSITGGYLSFLTPIAPPVITANVNDYNPTGLDSSGLVLLSADNTYNISGLQAPTTAWKTIYLMNYSSFTLNLLHNSGLSAAANRFFNYPAATYGLGSGETVMFFYDSLGAVWRMVK